MAPYCPQPCFKLLSVVSVVIPCPAFPPQAPMLYLYEETQFPKSILVFHSSHTFAYAVPPPGMPI